MATTRTLNCVFWSKNTTGDIRKYAEQRCNNKCTIIKDSVRVCSECKFYKDKEEYMLVPSWLNFFGVKMLTWEVVKKWGR